MARGRRARAKVDDDDHHDDADPTHHEYDNHDGVNGDDIIEQEEIMRKSPRNHYDNNNDDDNAPDENTLRILLSTDNHLGYLERDPIRGLDSFAALEEVLSIARQHKCDMVLLSGDLFHDNKPSRRTLHSTMEILRRYCMGSESVGFQIVSDQKECLRSVVSGRANYEDEFYSVSCIFGEMVRCF